MNDKLKPALIGGVALGIASALPYLNYVNMICCALYIAGGVLACRLYLKDLSTPPASPYGDGAVVGLLAGIFGGVAAAIANVLMRFTGYGEEEAAQTLAQMEQAGVELPAFVMDLMGANGISANVIFVTLISSVVLYAIFGTLGGLLGIAIFHKKEDATS